MANVSEDIDLADTRGAIGLEGVADDRLIGGRLAADTGGR